jgi:chromosome segregation ATPase
VPTLYEKRQSASKSARSLSSNVPAQLALLTEQQKAITEILQRIADRDERIEQLENDNTKLKRKLFQIEQEMKKPWWKKIFR